jgi:peroxiredoxin
MAQAIIKRAQKNQRAILHLQPSKRDRDQLKALAQWQSIEQTAQTLAQQIQSRIWLVRAQSVREAPPPGQHVQRPLANNALLTRLDGKQERMAQHHGEVIFVHFWATWCWPCVQEIASLQRLHEQFRAQKFVLLAVSLDARKKDLISFFHKHDLHLPVYFDPGRTVYQQLIGGLEVLPRSLLIDQAGRIVRSYAGAQHLASPATLTDIKRLLDNN